MTDQVNARIRFLIRKKRTVGISDEERIELVELLNIVRKRANSPPGEKVAASLVLATLTSRLKPKELIA